MTKTLNVPISEKTRRKLGALAILTGQKFDSIEAEIAQLLDNVLSQKIDAAMAAIDGRSIMESASLSTAPTVNKFAQAEQESMTAEQEDESIVDDIAGHSLSADADEGSPSLQEEYEAAETKMRQQPAPRQSRSVLPQQPQTEDIRPPEIDAEDVGSNVEAFLDEALSVPKAAAKAGTINRFGRATATTDTYNAAKRKARVSDYTGTDEDIF